MSTPTLTAPTFTSSVFANAKPVDNTYADVPAEIAADLRGSLGYFSAKNSNKLSVNHPDGEDGADLLKRQIMTYAKMHGLAASFPKYSPEHMSKAVVDEKTGKVTKPAKLIPANKIDKGANVGANVTFRLYVPKDDDDTDTDDE